MCKWHQIHAGWKAPCLSKESVVCRANSSKQIGIGHLPGMFCYVDTVQDCLEASEILLFSRDMRIPPLVARWCFAKPALPPVLELGQSPEHRLFQWVCFSEWPSNAPGWYLVQTSLLRKRPASGETPATPRVSLVDFSLLVFCLILWEESPKSSFDQVQFSSPRVG